MIGVVLAGGASLRFGGRPKGLMLLDGVPMAVRVHRLLSSFCSRVFIEALPDAGYEALGVECIYAAADDAGKGPLAGIAAGLAVAGADDTVAFAPCDMPLLTAEAYARLAREAEGAYAVSDMGVEPLVCVLPARLLADVRAVLRAGRVVGVSRFLEQSRAVPVRFEDNKIFSNVNTPDELSRISAQMRS